MFSNRPTDAQASSRIEQPTAAPAPAFVACPAALLPGPWVLPIYLAAYAQARAAVEERWTGLLNLECWN